MIINKFISIILATVVLKKHSNKLKGHCYETKTNCPFLLCQLQLHVSYMYTEDLEDVLIIIAHI